jgi:CheY-like chemotaxis protein/two-component sensor histidine kinase
LVLDVARITNDKIVLRKQSVDLNELIDHVVATCHLASEASARQISMKLCDKPLMCDGDPIRISQIFSNLLNNAIKYTPNGGRIEIRAERRGEDAVVTVADTGVGIPADVLPHIFELFVQRNHALVRDQGGLGIGLALVKRFVELHGGKIETHSDGEDRGSCFVVRLPLSAAANHNQKALPIAPLLLDTSLRVLVIDDVIEVADSFALLLKALGARVQVAYGGAAGLTECADFKPDLVFLDIGMPVMDGFETARRMRELTAGRKATLVALTGWGEEKTRGRALEAGFDRHLTKPANIELVEALLDDARRLNRREICDEARVPADGAE